MYNVPKLAKLKLCIIRCLKDFSYLEVKAFKYSGSCLKIAPAGKK